MTVPTSPEQQRLLAQLLGDTADIPLFKGLPIDAVLTALDGSSVLTLPAGKSLLRPGESNSSMYILLSGELAAYLDVKQQDGTAIVIHLGECVGELSALDGKPASALVLAQRDAMLLEIPGKVFCDQILTLPGVAGNLLIAMAERMRKSNLQALKTQREQLELQHIRRELSVARELQTGMVPPLQCPLFGKRSDIDVCGFMEPASEIGGDLFDCFFIDQKHLFFCIGDVSGHGIAAALFMARVVSVLRIMALQHVMSPASLLAEVNSRLCEGNDASIFVTLFCGYLDVVSGRLCYTNAGHCAPLLAWEGGSRVLPVPKGTLLGAFPDITYTIGEIHLAQGEVLLCYTDGLTEATNAGMEEFGEERLLTVLAAGWHEPLPELLAGIRSQVGQFMTAPLPEDDCTLLALRR